MVKPLDSYVVCKIVALRWLGLSYKKLKKCCDFNLDRQLEQFISAFCERILMDRVKLSKQSEN